jgi:hypothetical protein
MEELDRWLEQATRHLSKDSVAQVRSEIRDHYESAREAAISSGATAEDAAKLALDALGDPRAANRQYRRVLLTSAEARLLREGNWEARAICSRPVLRGVLSAVPPALLLAAAASHLSGAIGAARVLLGAGMAMSVLFAPLFLPVYTPARGLVFRCVKWAVLVSGLALAFGPDLRRSHWLLICCLWPMIRLEGTRASIRRKLPVADWPKQLYL